MIDRKKYKVVFCLVVIIIIGIIVGLVAFSINNGPCDKEKVAERAKRHIQAATFQMYSIDDVRYNGFTKKYKIILSNITTNEKVKVYGICDKNTTNYMDVEFNCEEFHK